MQDLISSIRDLLGSDMVAKALHAAVILLVGLLLAAVVPRRIRIPKLHPQRLFLIRKVVHYALVAITLVWTLRELGFNLSVLLGAAGIFTVAIGFASQTSVSNLISGFFLMGEQPFGVGDVIKVSDITGEVLSIDPLSVKLRTFDNLMVRIPNETMLKSNVTNLTRFPIRRVDLNVGVAYKEDLEEVSKILMEVADRCPICMQSPKPLLIFLGFGDSSINIQFSVWGTSENFLALRNQLYVDIKKAFDEHQIEIPYPHRSLYAGAATGPLPVQLVSAGTSAATPNAREATP